MQVRRMISTWTVYERLDREWPAAGAGLEAREAVKRWVVDEPPLAGSRIWRLGSSVVGNLARR